MSKAQGWMIIALLVLAIGGTVGGYFVPHRVVGPAPTAVMGQHWEYFVGTPTGRGLQQDLHTAGLQRWDLVAVTSDGHYVMRRPAQQSW